MYAGPGHAPRPAFLSEPERFSGVAERCPKDGLIEAQSTAIARAMASIRNDEQVVFGGDERT